VPELAEIDRPVLVAVDRDVAVEVDDARVGAGDGGDVRGIRLRDRRTQVMLRCRRSR
jgi:hypothetical protein